MTVSTPFVVSAPGKVILFGEHSAVYCKPAIAAALSLRTYLMVEPSALPDTIALEFPDIGFSHSWNRQELPWGAATVSLVVTELLVPELVSALANHLPQSTAVQASAAYAFLYLYMNLCSKETVGMTYAVRSTLPIGAGLGSSASISVCLAAALALLGGHISAGAVKEGPSVETADAVFIENWSFMGEKCIHGTPSGIDNAVATHGGAVMFQKTNSSLPSVRTTMRNFPSLRLVLTNTTQPRKTSDLVAGVARINADFPATATAILNAMEAVADEAYTMMIRPQVDLSRLHQLVEINHGLLVALGVSHPKLERVKMVADELGIGATKLTGAGGGGCAITLVGDVDESQMDQLAEAYEKEGFEMYETMLGGRGMGYLSGPLPFSMSEFVALQGRGAVEKRAGVTALAGWRYW